MTLADVGARWGPSERWRQLSPPVQVIAFEPDEAECKRLAAADTSGAVRYEPVALGAQPGKATLYLTSDPACSSLYPPDPSAVAAHAELEVTSLAGERSVDLQTLDAWCANAGVEVDALKLDLQGAELDVLAGGRAQLRHVVALEVEVEFNPIYVGQPLFADVDSFLRAERFVLWRLGNLVHYGRRDADTTVPIDDLQAFDSRVVPINGQGGQLFWGHAYYVAADVLDGATGARLRRAAVAAGAFGFPDLADMLLARAASVGAAPPH